MGGPATRFVGSYYRMLSLEGKRGFVVPVVFEGRVKRTQPPPVRALGRVRRALRFKLRMKVLKLVEERKRKVGELAAKLGIEDKLDRFPEELSGGERQRVAIACALANNPPLIIADEPTGELDSENARAVTEILVGLAREGRTVIIATHDPLVARMADRIILLRDGKIEGEVLPAELGEGMRAPTSAEEAYLELVENRIRSLDEELRHLAERFARGALGLEEFLERASRIRLLKEALESELLRFGRQPRR